MELTLENHFEQILVLNGQAGTVTLNPGKKARDNELLLGLSVVLSFLGMEVFTQQVGGEEGQEQQQEEWVVRKGSWSQVMEDGVTVSAFASREWPKIASKLQMLPKYVMQEHALFVAPSPAPAPPVAVAAVAVGEGGGGEVAVSVLGKRAGEGEGGDEGGLQGGQGGPGRGGGGGRGRGRGRSVNLWAGSNKWVRT